MLGLSGYARTGKDTVAAILVRDHGYRRVAFADKLREVALAADPVVYTDIYAKPVRLSEMVEAIGWEWTKDRHPEARRTLQALGCGVRDVLGSNVWVDAALADVADGDRVVITDVRFRNEAAAIARRGGSVVRVHRPDVGPVNDHVSEHDLDDWQFGADVYNAWSLDDLAETVNRLVAELTVIRCAAEGCDRPAGRRRIVLLWPPSAGMNEFETGLRCDNCTDTFLASMTRIHSDGSPMYRVDEVGA